RSDISLVAPPCSRSDRTYMEADSRRFKLSAQDASMPHCKNASVRYEALTQLSSTLGQGSAMTRWVYGFGDGRAEGSAGDRDLLGGKGANLAEMCSLGLPVPPGFTITTGLCNHYYANGRTYPSELEDQVASALGEVGRIAGKRFGDPQSLLLV